MPDHRAKSGRKPRPRYTTGVSVRGTCCQCGRETRTPFVPRDPDAVLCDECYRQRFDKPPPGAQADARGKLYDSICVQCGARCQIPWRSSDEEPAVCWTCARGLPVQPAEKRLPGAARLPDGRVVRVRNKKAE